MADRTPMDAIADRWPSLRERYGSDMPREIVAVLEAAGYRIVPLEPTEAMVTTLHEWSNHKRRHKSVALEHALAAAPTWGDKP